MHSDAMMFTMGFMTVGRKGGGTCLTENKAQEQLSRGNNVFIMDGKNKSECFEGSGMCAELTVLRNYFCIFQNSGLWVF